MRGQLTVQRGRQRAAGGSLCSVLSWGWRLRRREMERAYSSCGAYFDFELFVLIYIVHTCRLRINWHV